MIIPRWKAFLWREVFAITEMRDGCVFKTQSVGFCKAGQKVGPGYVLASISTGSSETVELEPLFKPI
jgi:hypothetical protein